MVAVDHHRPRPPIMSLPRPLLALTCIPAAHAQDQWVGAWATSPVPAKNPAASSGPTAPPAQPSNPGIFLSSADSGVHLHPGDAGYKATADSIDLKLFTK
jgi:hypothetical protein